jgi:hypothetical protein
MNCPNRLSNNSNWSDKQPKKWSEEEIKLLQTDFWLLSSVCN